MKLLYNDGMYGLTPKDFSCHIVSVDSLLDEEMVFEQIQSITDRDPNQVIDEASWLFDKCGIQPDYSHENLFEACITHQGEVLGVSAVGLYSQEPMPGDPLRRQQYSFSIAVSPKARRRGIARTLVESLIQSFPGSLLVGKVVNPHMSKLLKDLQFIYQEEPEDEDTWTQHETNWGRTMYRPRRNPEPEITFEEKLENYDLVILAKMGDRAIGSLEITPIQTSYLHQSKPVTSVTFTQVAPIFRRHNIATEMYRRAARLLAQKNIYLGSGALNASSLAFWKKQESRGRAQLVKMEWEQPQYIWIV